MSDIIARDGIRAFLLQVLKAETGIDLKANEVVFQAPTLLDASVTTYDDPDKRNTSVRIEKEASGGNPEVSVLLRYNRLSLSKLFDFRSTTLTLNPSFTSVHQYLPALNTRLGTALTTEDVNNGVLTGADETFALSAPESSLYAFGNLNITLVGEVVPEPEEEDEMYYNLIPPEMWQDFNESEQMLSVQIGTNCGYPTYLKSSLPTDLTFKDLGDYGNLNRLQLLEGKLYMLRNNTAEMVSKTSSSFGYNSGNFGPNSEILAGPQGEQLTEIGQFAMAETGNANRIEFLPIGGDWFSRYASEGGQLLMFRAKFNHPNVLDQKGERAAIYWNTTLSLEIAAPIEEDDVYFHLIASDMSYTVDDANRNITLRIGALDSSVSDSFLVSSDQAQFGAIGLKANFGDLGDLSLQEGHLYAVGSESPAVFQQHFTQTGQYADQNVMPSSAGYIQQGGLAQTREIGSLAQEFIINDLQNIKLFTDDSSWYNNYLDYNGRYLLIRARFAHPSYNKPDGQPIPIWYNGMIKLTLDSGEVPQA